jgi:hypothetical protein
MISEPLKPERLQAIQEADEAAGPDLQFYTPPWTHRRELLGHVLALEEERASIAALVYDLDVLLNGEDGAARCASLCDIVAQVRKWVAERRIMTDENIIQMRREHQAAEQ